MLLKKFWLHFEANKIPFEANTAVATPPAIEMLLLIASRRFEEELLTNVGGGGLELSSTARLGEGTV